MGQGRAVAIGIALAACGCVDLFHSTDWKTLCNEHPGSDGCGAGAPGAGGASASSASTSSAAAGGAGGAGGGCTAGSTRPCYPGPDGTADVGACKSGEQTCANDGATWGACTGAITPADEVCGDGVDGDCNGVIDDACPALSCAALGANKPTGIYFLDPDGAGPEPGFSVYCDMQTDGGGWALLENSVGSANGTTLAFWQYAYADRLQVKGSPPTLSTNVYAGALYAYGKEYKDEIVDQASTSVIAVRAQVSGFDTTAMTFVAPVLVAGDQAVFDCHFAAGWASGDFDGDTYAQANCSANYANVAQHYCACWNYNLGADADAPFDDGGWGPHVASTVASGLGLATDGTGYTRVSRISRWTRW